MTDQTVYRSSAPEVLAILDTYRAETEAWHVEAARLVADLGFGDRHLVSTTGFGGKRIIGVEVRDGDHEAVPAGWRIADRSGVSVFIPDKRRKAGKDAAKAFAECKPPVDPRDRMPGMPGEFMAARGHLLAPGMEERGDVLFVIWPTDKVPEIPADGADRDAFFAVVGDRRQIRTGIDLSIWERMKLSAWYALLEAEEATANA